MLNFIEPRLSTNVAIVCPTSGQLVPTGVSADALLEDATRYVLVRCAGCSGEHMWLPDDAIVMGMPLTVGVLSPSAAN